MPGSGPLTTVEGSPWLPQRSARRRHADMPPAGRPSAVLPVFEAESQQPGNFSLDVQDRMGGVQLLLQGHFRLELVRAGGLRSAGFRPRLLGVKATPHAAPDRQRGVQPLAAKQPAHLAGLRAALCLLQNPHDTATCASSAWPRPPGDGPTGWLRPRGPRRDPRPQGRSVHSCNVIDSLSAVIGIHLHRPTEFQGGPVSQ